MSGIIPTLTDEGTEAQKASSVISVRSNSTEELCLCAKPHH